MLLWALCINYKVVYKYFKKKSDIFLIPRAQSFRGGDQPHIFFIKHDSLLLYYYFVPSEHTSISGKYVMYEGNKGLWCLY